MSPEREPLPLPPPLQWVGGWLCLDFHNTIDWEGLEAAEDERLSTFGRLVQWSGEAGVLSDGTGARLLSEAAKRPTAARRVLQRAWDLRATIHALFFAIIRGEHPDPTALRSLNDLLAEVPAEVQPTGSGEAQFGWGWRGKPNDLACMLWPIAWSAGQLLTSPDLVQVKTCANDTCGWLFLDISRKHNRRWCEMRTCGNRAKARRFHERRGRGSGRGGAG